MPKPVSYKNDKQSKNETMSLREKLLWSFLGAAGLTGLVVLGRKIVLNKIEDKAQSKSFDDGTSQTIAKQIYMAFDNDGNFGTDTKALRQILINIKSKKQLKEVFDEYKHEYHSNMYLDMGKELQTSEYNEMLQIMAAKPEKTGGAPPTNQYSAWAKRLKAAFDKTYSFIPGTDESAIKAVFTEIPTQKAFIQVGVAYKKEYGDNLIEALKGELEIWEYGDYMSIITSKPKA